MTTLDEERVAATGPERPDVPPGQSRYASDPQFTAALKASVAVASALRHLTVALRKLGVAEGQRLLAGIPVFFAAAAALVVFGATMWLCLNALIGWALLVGTGSLGLALGLLVVINAFLVICVGAVVVFALREATFPRARAELRKIKRSLLQDLRSISGMAAADGERAAASGTPSGEDGK